MTTTPRVTHHHSTSQTGAVFGIRATRECDPFHDPMGPPESRVICLSGNYGHGYKSAYRRLAKELGYPNAHRTYRYMSMDGVETVDTYWMRDLALSAETVTD